MSSFWRQIGHTRLVRSMFSAECRHSEQKRWPGGSVVSITRLGRSGGDGGGGVPQCVMVRSLTLSMQMTQSNLRNLTRSSRSFPFRDGDLLFLAGGTSSTSTRSTTSSAKSAAPNKSSSSSSNSGPRLRFGAPCALPGRDPGRDDALLAEVREGGRGWEGMVRSAGRTLRLRAEEDIADGERGVGVVAAAAAIALGPRPGRKGTAGRREPGMMSTSRPHQSTCSDWRGEGTWRGR